MFFQWCAIAFGLLSAAAWFRAAVVKVSREAAVDRIEKKAKRSGVAPNFAGASFDGWDSRETMSAQYKWNSCAAVLAAFAIAFQATAQIVMP